MTWREERERWLRERTRLIAGRKAEDAAGGERPWRAVGMPPDAARRLAELRLQMPGWEAAAILLEERIGRIAPLQPRKWAVHGFGPGWGTCSIAKRKAAGQGNGAGGS